MRTLRPYQQAALDATLEQLKSFNSTITVLPTGLGKTVYASKLITGWERGNCLFLAHTRELINQAADKLAVELGFRPAVEMNVQGAELETLYQGGLVVVLSAFGLAGYAGLWLAPAAAPLAWALLLGLANSAFPLALTMIGLRARSGAGVVRLSAFAQSTGYLLSIPGPLLVGALYQHTGGWTAPLALIAAGAMGAPQQLPETLGVKVIANQ